MLRFKMGMKVEPVALPADKRWGQSHPGYEPYEQIRSMGKNWQIVQLCDGDRVVFYNEQIHTGQKLPAISEKLGIESYHKAVEQWKYCESLPAGQMPGIQGSSQQPIKPEKLEKTADEIRKEELEKQRIALEKSFADIQDKLKKGRAEVDAEMMRRQLSEAKQNMMELEKQFLKMNPVVDGDND